MKKSQNYRKWDQTCSYQRWDVGAGELEEGDQKVQTSSHKRNKHQGHHVQRNDYS